MDSYEATKIVMSRIQNLDPENSSKIMGYILIQDQGEKEMIRLALGSESLLLSHINQVKSCLGLTSNPSFPPRVLIPSPSSLSPRPFSYGGKNSRIQDPLMSPSGMSDSMGLKTLHRRSCSVNDAAFLEEGGGLSWKPCMYFARGFCKNGSGCKFLHSEFEGIEVGSPSSGFDDMLRMKLVHNQRFPFMSSGGHHQHNPFALPKGFDFVNDNSRNEFSTMGLSNGVNSSSRQIYLTFPADSTFKEEDVSNYFSTFGPVQDVRIPYQQKRMFGFVTFVFPDTVKLILAKGNPHFVCDSRVLVKPYKEKGRLLDKKQLQLLERGELSDCLSPSSIDGREHVDLPVGPRLLYGAQEMMLRRQLEEAELHRAMELQSRRMMNLQLMDSKIRQHSNNFRPGIPISSPRQTQLPMNQNFNLAPDVVNQDHSKEFNGSQETESTDMTIRNHHVNNGESDARIFERLEQILPDNLFSSPTKLAAEHHSFFSQASVDETIPLTISSSNNTASRKPCYVQIPRFEAIEM